MILTVLTIYKLVNQCQCFRKYITVTMREKLVKNCSARTTNKYIICIHYSCFFQSLHICFLWYLMGSVTSVHTENINLKHFPSCRDCQSKCCFNFLGNEKKMCLHLTNLTAICGKILWMQHLKCQGCYLLDITQANFTNTLLLIMGYGLYFHHFFWLQYSNEELHQLPQHCN